jgi:hypothetical protein
MMACIKASMAGQRGEFASGIKLDAKTTKRIPPNMIGRSLTNIEAEALLKRISR